jgi:hypothetical protein
MASILEIDFKSGFTDRCEIPYVSCFSIFSFFLLCAYTPLSKMSPFVVSRLRRGHAKTRGRICILWMLINFMCCLCVVNCVAFFYVLFVFIERN